MTIIKIIGFFLFLVGAWFLYYNSAKEEITQAGIKKMQKNSYRYDENDIAAETEKIKIFEKNKRRGVVILIIGAIVLILGLSLVVVPTGYTGVRATLGQISETPVARGLNFKIPLIQSVEKVNNKQQEYRSNESTQFWAETKARTAVYYQDVTVTFTIKPEFSAWIYANISNYKDTLLSDSLLGSALKTASKTLVDEEATSRGIIEKLTQEELQKALNEKYKNEIVTINKITIANADFDETYTTAIAEKQAAQLAYEKQTIINKNAIEKAEAAAEVKKIQAQGEAEAAIIAAKGEKEANDTLNKSLNDTIIKNKAVEKWDGKLPQVTNGEGVLIDVTG